MLGRMETHGVSDRGCVRETNDDQFMIADLSKALRVHETSLSLEASTRLFGQTQGRLLLVADGMGRRDAGERASQLALDGIVDFVLNNLSWYLLNDEFDDADFQQELKSGLRHCHRLIEKEAALLANRANMRSTLTLAYIAWPRMFCVHVGNSRCYLLRSGEIKQLTRDQTTALAAAPSDLQRGAATTQRGPGMTQRGPGIRWTLVGAREDPHPDATSIDLQIGDAIVLCTDGLTAHVSDERIYAEIDANCPLEDACGRLIATANKAGGSDNSTIVACRFLRADQIPEREQTESLPSHEPSAEQVIAPSTGSKTVPTSDAASPKKLAVLR